jgi:hypothetical protein
MSRYSSMSTVKALAFIAALGSLLGLLPVHPASASGHVILQPDASFHGEDPLDRVSETSYVGDVNGDGLGDFVVSSPHHGPVDYRAGKVYLWFGSEAGWAVDTSLALSDASFLGEAASNIAGQSIDYIGDFDGDGFDDIAIGAPQNNEAGTFAGKVYIVWGTSGPWANDVSLAEMETSFLGEDANDSAGFSAAGVGDVNGDGFDDIVIGSHGNEEGGTGAGQAYLILGDSQRPSTSVSLINSDASWLGQATERLGHPITGSGDLDGDGLDDFVLSASYYNQLQGRIRLVLGRETGWQTDIPHNEADAYFHGEYTDDRFGCSASIVGDADGDGLDDLLVGAIYSNGGGNERGRAYLLFGRSQGWPADGPIATEADAIFQGEEDFDWAGAYVGAAGDINGDTLADFLVKAGSDDGGENSGQVYLVLGRIRGWEAETALDFADASLIGEAAFDSMGVVHRNGDLDGDGLSDFLAGAMGNDEHGTSTGQIYLVLGSECWDIDWDGYDSCSGDCDDNWDVTYPNAPEQCDGEDNDCDGTVDEGTDEDDDGDGFTECDGDCDDFDALRNPNGVEICNGLDDDCDGELMADEVDEDLDGVMECEGDCDDEDDSIFPGAEEVCGDGEDNDCDGETDEGCGDDDDDDVSDDDDDTDDDDDVDDDDSAQDDDDDDDDDCAPGDDTDDVTDDCECNAGGTNHVLPTMLLLVSALGLIRRRS